MVNEFHLWKVNERLVNTVNDLTEEVIELKRKYYELLNSQPQPQPQPQSKSTKCSNRLCKLFSCCCKN
jgi:hypothetical protein